MPTRWAGPSPAQAPHTRPLLRTVLAAFGVAIVAGLVLRSFIIGAVKVPSSSMESTVLPGDVILVSKLSASHWFLPLLPFVSMPLAPVRLPPVRPVSLGDVVVFRTPRTDALGRGRATFLVKRCIGTPGDVLRFDGGVVSVNGRPLHFPPTAVQTETPADFFAVPTTIVVPEGSYFMIGDNSAASMDSRRWGAVPREAVIGTAMLIYWSVEPRSSRAGLPVVRWSRIGTLVR